MLDSMETHTATVAPFDTRTEFDNAVAKAAEAAEAYYDTDAVVMVDADYDTLVDRIAATRDNNPDWDDHGVTSAVAGGQSAGGDVTHPVPMLSLSKTKSIDEVADFVRRVNGLVAVEVKIDGLAVRVEYRNGILVLAATRGDGLTGENVTPQVLRGTGIHGLPTTLPTAWTGEVRGEIFMTDTDFDAASNLRVERGGKPFANPRNATAGSLRKTGDENFMPMSFAAYDITGEIVDNHDSYLGRMAEARRLGFQTASHIGPDSTRWSTVETVAAAIARIESLRDTLGFPIDGAVIKADLDADRARLGSASRTPRWATSFKYSPREASSVLRSVEVSIGRTGRLSLTAHIDPVLVDGSVVSKASGHNAPWMAAAGLGPGMNILVVKRGDIIPYISLLDGDQPANATPWVAPETCPQCGEAWDKTSILWRCHTPACSVTGKIEWFGDRSTMDVEGLSTATAEALVEAGLVNDIADLFDLTVEQVAAVKIGTTSSGADRLIGTATATRLINGIEASKSQPLNRVIASLGLRFTGKTFGRRFADAFKTLEAFRDATLEELMQVEAVKDGRGTLIHKGLQDSRDTIDRLIAAGVTTAVEEAAAPEGKELPFVGMKVVVSGTVPGMGRTEAQEAAIKLGAVVSGSVSKNTSLLVAGDGAGSKMTKAEALGVTVMPAEDFAALYASIFG